MLLGRKTMGYDAYSFAVVGLAITANKLYTKKKVKAFEHNHPESMSFCPNTGKPLWGSVFVFLDGTEPEFEDFQELTVTLKSSEESIADPTTICFVGHKKRAARDGPLCFWTMAEIEQIKIELKETLSRYNLWDESKFGVYPVLYESC